MDKIRVAVYKDVGAGPSVQNLMEVLDGFPNLTWQVITAEQILKDGLSDYDVLIHPGGSGGGQGRHLGEDGRAQVCDFVSQGGGFIGVCAGAYLASSDYPWSLHILNARVVDKKHWARGTGTVVLKVTEKGRELFGAESEQFMIHYGQGPLLGRGEHPDLPEFDVLASYDSEIAKKGAPEGVMKGTTAIASGRFGSGRVFCFSPHPEKTDGLGWLVQRAVCWVGEGEGD